jgi:methionine aminopeptidase
MQTLTINVQDGFLTSFLQYVENHKDTIKLNDDANLAYDPFFYQRQKELQKIRNESKSDKTKMETHAQVWGNVKSHLKL